MNDDLSSLLDFVSFTHDIQSIKRSMWVRGVERFENDSEHGYQVAICALYIIESRELDLNPFRAMGIALVHDILEVYAGDTPIYASGDVLASKKEREAKALKRVKQKWPDLPLMHKLIDEYETMESAESKFIYALDKLLPILNNYLDNGRNWKKSGVELNQVIAAKTEKISVDPTITHYYKAIIETLRNKPELFR